MDTPEYTETEQRKVKYRLFTYDKEIPNPQFPGQLMLVKQHAVKDEVVDLLPHDVAFGEREDIDAFYSDADEETVNADDVLVTDLDVEELAAYINENAVTISEAAQLVLDSGPDAEFAQRMLDADAEATQGEPRVGLEKAIAKILGDAGN